VSHTSSRLKVGGRKVRRRGTDNPNAEKGRNSVKERAKEGRRKKSAEKLKGYGAHRLKSRKSFWKRGEIDGHRGLEQRTRERERVGLHSGTESTSQGSGHSR